MRRKITWRRLANAAGDYVPWRDHRKIGFMHVPKTSGTAIIDAISDKIRPGRKFYAFDGVLFGQFDAFDEIHPPVRGMIHPDPATLPRRADFLAGHMALSTLQAAGRDTLMTILREPSVRLLSHWMFWRNHDEAALAKLGSWADSVRVGRQPLAEFLSNPAVAVQTDNLLARMLLWPHALIPVADFIDPAADAALLEAALERLGRFAFVDLVENPAMASNLQSWLGRRLAYVRANETAPLLADRRTTLATEMTARAKAAMAARCRLDCVLWMHVAARCVGADAAPALQRQAVESGMQRAALLLGGKVSSAEAARAAA